MRRLALHCLLLATCLSPLELWGAPSGRTLIISELGSGHASEGEHELVLTVELPKGHAFTAGAPIRAEVDFTQAIGIQPNGETAWKLEGKKMIVRAPLKVGRGAKGSVAFEVSLYYCGEEKTLCLVDRRRLVYGLTAAEVDSPREIGVTYRPPSPPSP